MEILLKTVCAQSNRSQNSLMECSHNGRTAAVNDDPDHYLFINFPSPESRAVLTDLLLKVRPSCPMVNLLTPPRGEGTGVGGGLRQHFIQGAT